MKYTNEDLKGIIEREGIGYTLTDYLNPNDIKDDEIRILAIRASDALQQIENKLGLS